MQKGSCGAVFRAFRRILFHSFFKLQIYAQILFFNLMLLHIAGQHQGQRAVTGYVAGSSEAVLKRKDG